MSDEPVTPASEPAPAATPAQTEAKPAPNASLLPLLVVALLVGVALLFSNLTSSKASGDLESLLASGKAALERGDPKESLIFFRQAHELAPEDPRTNAWLADALIQLDSFTEALDYATKARDKAPSVARHQVLYGLTLIGLKRTKEARGPLEEAMRLDPKDPRPLVRLGLADMLDQDFAGAERSFHAYLTHERVGGRDLPVMKFYADSLQLQGKEAASIAVMESLCGMIPRDVGLRRQIDMRRMKREGYEAVLADARRAAEAKDASTPELIRLARLLARDPSERGKVKGLLEQAVALEKKSTAQPKLPWAQLGLGMELFREGDLVGARRLLEEASQLAPGLPEALHFESVLLRREGKFEEARAILERLFEKEDGLQVRTEYMESFLDQGKPEEAVAWARKQGAGAPSRSPGHPAHALLAEALAGAGQLAEAADVWSRFAAASPADVRPSLDGRLGTMWLEANEPAKAREAFDRGLEAFAASPRRPLDMLAWGGVAWVGSDADRARKLWGEGAEKGQAVAPEALLTSACKRLLGQASAEDLKLAATAGTADEANDALFFEGLARELSGDAAGAREAYQAALKASRAKEFPARLAEARLAGLAR